MDAGTQQLDYFPEVSFEFITDTHTVFFDCFSPPARCVTWNVWIIPGRRMHDRFPFMPLGQPAAHFLSTDVSLSASLEVLLRELGVDTFRDPTLARMKPQR